MRSAFHRLVSLGFSAATVSMLSMGPTAGFDPASAIPMQSNVEAPNVQSISCSDAVDCTEVGSYVIDGRSAAMVSSELHGQWTKTKAIAAPDGDSAALSSVSCTAIGDCVAAGSFGTPTNYREPIVVSEENGVWGRPQTLSTPALAAHPPFELLLSISCPAEGACVAVGTFLSKTGRQLPLVEAERAGRWTRPQAIDLPPDAARGGVGPLAQLTSVSCTSPSACTAVGNFSTTSNTRGEMAVSEHGANWGEPVEIASGPNGGVSGELAAVSCTQRGTCTAVGELQAGSDGAFEPAVVTEVDGSWRQAQVVRAINGGVGVNGEFLSVSCERHGACTTVGSFVDTANESEPMIAVGRAGSWGPDFGGVVPRGGIVPGSALDSVSCVSTICTAVGDYVGPSFDQRIMSLRIPG